MLDCPDFSLRKIFYPDTSFSSLHLISPLRLATGKAHKTLTPLETMKMYWILWDLKCLDRIAALRWLTKRCRLTALCCQLHESLKTEVAVSILALQYIPNFFKEGTLIRFKIFQICYHWTVWYLFRDRRNIYNQSDARLPTDTFESSN